MAKERFITGLSVAILTFVFAVFIVPCSNRVSAKELTGLTSEEIVSEMGIGWNLGNTFDATGGNRSNIFSQETSWGNPQVTRELIQAIHDKGFKTIRIPVTWMNQINKSDNYSINPDFLNRVQEVVDYAYELDMYIILNVHHESWVNSRKLGEVSTANDGTVSAGYFEIGEELSAVWSQIADHFADYDQHLIFEGMNEPRMSGTDIEWTGNSTAYDGVNYLNQVFTYTIRNNGKGRNSERCLMIPDYAASSSADILKTLTIPTYNGEPVKNLIVSVHCYSPYDFCLSDTLSDFNPDNKAHTSSIDQLFKTLEEYFLYNDIPVVIGETGATNTNDNTEARERWAQYMGKKAYEYGIPIVLWDNGANGKSGGECHAWINRRTCEWNYPTVIDKLLGSDGVIDWGEKSSVDILAYKEINGKKTSISGGNPIWENPDGIVISPGEGNESPITIPVIRSYVSASVDIAVAFSGASRPGLVFHSESKNTSSGCIEPYKTEEINGKLVAFFKYRTINDSLKEAGITNPSQVSTMSIGVQDAEVTVYEISTVSENASITYVVGSTEYAGTNSFENAIPELPGLKFLGWYTTKTFEEDSKFNGNIGRDVTLYGKFALNSDSGADSFVITPEPTPEPTAEPTPVSTKEPTPEPTATQVPEVTETPSVPTVTPVPSETDKSTSESGLPAYVYILIAVCAVLFAGGVFFIIKRKQK